MTVPTDVIAVRVCDALAARYDAEASLADHTTVARRRVLFVRPEDVPLLNVYPLFKTYVPEGTENLGYTFDVMVVWQEQSVESVTTLVEDMDVAASLLVAMDELERVTQEIMVVGWDIDTEHSVAHEVIPVSLDYLPPEDISPGAVEGYAMTVRVTITQKRRPT